LVGPRAVSSTKRDPWFASPNNYSFITPSIFEKHNSADWPVYDEWTLCEKLGPDHCADALKPHWENFVSLNDFWKIKGAGFNVVRIPVGYWR
jgi:glucan 1,3-beta-glucosidase